jgi:hypothetical protein
VFWRTSPFGKILWEREGAPFAGAESALPVDTDPRVLDLIARYNRAPWSEYAIEIDVPHVLEPSCGWAVKGLRTRVDRSLPEGVKCIPRVSRYLAKRALYGRRARTLDAVVSLRTGYETNYFHLFDDVLPRLALLDAVGVDRATPIVIGSPLWQSDYFQKLVERGPLREREWIPQHGRLYVESRRTFVSKTFPPGREVLEQVLSLIGVDTSAFPEPERRIFVRRDERFGRVLRNSRELERIAESAGFDVVEPGALDVEEQIRLFSAARTVVGVHGAGLANLVYRGTRPLDLLELFPPTWHGPQYFWNASALGHGYRGLFGDRDGDEHDFVVSPAAFERELEATIAA